jgi:CBS domain-containing protein
MIHQTQAVTVALTTPIREAIRLMKEHQIGSLLVVSNTETKELMGIFTERDLLFKVDLIEKRLDWDVAIGSFMTPNPVALELKDLPKASSLMAQHRFRHLPIIERDPQGRPLVVGMLSMRDLFKSLIENSNDHPSQTSPWLLREEGIQTTLQLTGEIKVLSQDRAFTSVIRHLSAVFFPQGRLDILSSLASLPLRSLQAERIKPFLAVDLDGLKTKEWARFLQERVQNPIFPVMLVAFDPQAHTKNTIQLLEKVTKMKHFAAFKKPIDLGALSDFFEKVVRHQKK